MRLVGSGTENKHDGKKAMVSWAVGTRLCWTLELMSDHTGLGLKKVPFSDSHEGFPQTGRKW